MQETISVVFGRLRTEGKDPIENIEEARQLWIKAAYEDGVEIPIPRTDEEYSGRFLVRILKSLHRQLAEQARYEGVSLNQYVESILSAGVSTRNVIEEIKAEFDKISRQITTRGATVRWQSLVTAGIGRKDSRRYYSGYCAIRKGVR